MLNTLPVDRWVDSLELRDLLRPARRVQGWDAMYPESYLLHGYLIKGVREGVIERQEQTMANYSPNKRRTALRCVYLYKRINQQQPGEQRTT